jgi:hypothetical protein
LKRQLWIGGKNDKMEIKKDLNWEGGNISNNTNKFTVIITPVGIDRCVCPSLD